MVVIVWVVVFAGVAGYFILRKKLYIPEPTTQINSFKECERAGYPVGENYPRQCRTPGGQQFIEEIDRQILPTLPIFLSTPKPSSTPNTTPVSNGNKCDVDPDENGNCPAGCVNYGVPLGCVTPEYYEECMSGKRSCPICLAGGTLIDTPLGRISVKYLEVGMPIWTSDQNGHRVLGIVIKTSKVPVPATHRVVHLILDDGREVFVSPGHPTVDGRVVGDLVSDDFYDGARVISVSRVVYGGDATYDILPSGDAGFYWADGILLDSTLH